MKVTLVAVGRVRGSLAEAVRDYELRAARYWKLQAIEVDAGGGGGEADAALRAEQARILARIPERAELVALTRAGEPVASRAFASLLHEHALHGRDVAFVIGGAFGLGEGILDRARRLSLSPMTLPHELARLVLAEQLYRAGTLHRGEPYHKGS